MIAGIYGPYNMIPIETEIEGIFDPQRDQDCPHIWSLLQPKLQAKSVPSINSSHDKSLSNT